MSIKTACPQCQANFELDDRLAGKTVRCQKCQGTFKVPEPPAAAESPLALHGPTPPPTSVLNPISVVDLPRPAGEVSVATMAGVPPAESEEEIIAGELVKRADTEPQSSPRSRRPAPVPTGNTGTGAIIAVIAVGLLACLLLAGGGGAAVFFLAIKPRPPRDGNRFDANKDRPVKEIDGKKDWDFVKDDKGKWDWDDGKKWDDKGRFDGKKDGGFDKDKGWKDEPKKKEKFGFRDDEKTLAPKTDAPDKIANLGRLEDLSRNELDYWTGIKFNDGNNLPGRVISPIPFLELQKNGRLAVGEANTYRGVSVFQYDFKAGKRVNIGMTSGDQVTLQIHDGDGVIATRPYNARNLRLALSFVPRKSGPHAIFVTSKEMAFIYFTLEVAFPSRPAVEVDLSNSATYFDNTSLTLDDNINSRMKEPSLGLCREYVVDMKIGYSYEFAVNSVGFTPIIQIESPDMKPLKDGGRTLLYRPTVAGKHHVFIAADLNSMEAYSLNISRIKD